MPLKPHEALAVGGMMTGLAGSNFPLRRPSHTNPSFWSRPLMRTLMRPVPAGQDWTDLVVVQGLSQYIAVVRYYVATSQGDIAVAGLQFRMLLNGSPVTGVTIGAGVEVSKEGPNTYPVIPRLIFQPVLETQTLQLQVKNPTALQRNAIGGFWGWYYEARDSTVFGGNSDDVTDATYPPFVGPGYG